MYLPALDPDRIAAVPRDPDDVLLLLVPEGEAGALGATIGALRGRGVRFFGAVFPALIDGLHLRHRGVLVLPVRLRGEPLLIRDPDRPGEALARLAEQLPDDADARPTVLVFVDATCGAIAQFLADTYAELGTTVTYLGGGAGPANLKRSACVFTEEGAAAGGAVVAMTPWSCTLGVRHGYRPLTGPMVATRTAGGRIVEIDWRPALEAYRRALRERRVRVGPTFRATSRQYPFGLVKEGREHVVRDPITSTRDGALVCVGEIAENAVLSVLAGEPSDLVAAASQAAREARPAPGVRVRHRLVMDCVSRPDSLGARFDEELGAIDDALREPGAAEGAIGALSIGEISSRGDGYLELFNKTTVIGVLHER